MSIPADDIRKATSETNTVQFQPDEIKVLREIIRTYRANKLDLSLRRPRFKQPRSNSGILLNDEIKRRALKKAKSDPDTTGTTLSRLVEFLLWRYIGSPSDVVERPDTKK